MTDGNATAELVPVTLVGFPLAVYGRALEHSTELMREFSLIALGLQDGGANALPVRLLAIVDQLTHDYAGVTDATDQRRDAALEAGLESVELTYLVPPAAAEASRSLRAVLEEADAFCDAGGALLTLATPPEARTFRDWYFDEFTGQIAGAAPTPWTEYAGARASRA